MREGNTSGPRCENSIVDPTSDIMDTVRDLCVEAALRLARGQKARWAFLIDQAAELLAERSQRLGVRIDQLPPARA